MGLVERCPYLTEIEIQLTLSKINIKWESGPTNGTFREVSFTYRELSCRK